MATTLTIEDSLIQSVDRKLARSIWYVGNLMTFHLDASDTNGRFALVEVTGRPGAEPPLHTHQYEDEVFYVLEGQLRFFRGDQEQVVVPGEACFLPRGVPHTFRVESERARGLVAITPAGFEQYFREIGRPAESLELPPPETPDIEKIVRTASQFGINFDVAARSEV
jgi:quercetin dioxygenase-like cupin family protein